MQFGWITIALALYLTSTSACNFPNDTETTPHWWDCGDGSFKVHDVTPLDYDYSYIYPILLKTGIYLSIQAENNIRLISNGDKDLKMNMDVWQYSGWSTCVWTPIPTFGLLNNLAACDDGGLICPVSTGQQNVQIKLDFTKYAAIIGLLKDDAPYQLRMRITDTLTNKELCLYIQARARTK